MTSGRLESKQRKALFDWTPVLERIRNPARFARLDLKLSQKGVVLASVPLFFELLLLGVLALALQQAERETAKAEHCKEVIGHTDVIVRSLYDTATELVGFTITGSQTLGERYDKSVEQINTELGVLEGLVKDDPGSAGELRKCHVLAQTVLELTDDMKRSIDKGDRAKVLLMSKDMMRQMKGLLDELIEQMQAFLVPYVRAEQVNPRAAEAARSLVKVVILVGIVFNIFLAMAVALFFSRGITQRLGLVTENTRRLARGEPLKPPLPGSDEIANLDRVFHDMAVALAEAARKERAVIENAVDVICSIDPAGKFTAVSPASLKLWGYAPEELVGRSFTGLIVAEDLDRTLESVRQIMTGRSSLPFENRTIRKDRSEVSVLWSAFWSETERSMFCVAHDITERKQAEDALRASEARVRQIIDSMPVGMMVIDRRGIIESLNPSMEKIFGYGRQELVGQHLMTLFAHAPDEDPEAFMRNVYEKSLGRVNEREAVRQNGEPFPTELSLSKFQTMDGERILVNILDLTERREVERLKREFVSTVSHELRTPLTAIRGSLTLMAAGAAGELTAQMRKVVAIAERNTIRLIGLINDLLDLEKLESGKLEMRFGDVPLATIIERSAESVRAVADQNGVVLEARSTDALVHADGDRLVQVLVNFLSNAIKFSPHGSMVMIGVRELGPVVEVSVTDQGPGIPAHYRDLLFQRFQQVDLAEVKKKGGSGLGLAICKAIIEQHEGTIGVESEEGRGSTFWFRIPAADNARREGA